MQIPASLNISNCNNVSDLNVTVMQLILIGSFLCVSHCLASRVAVMMPLQAWGSVGGSLVCFADWGPVTLHYTIVAPGLSQTFPPNTALTVKFPNAGTIREKPTFWHLSPVCVHLLCLVCKQKSAPHLPILIPFMVGGMIVGQPQGPFCRPIRRNADKNGNTLNPSSLSALCTSSEVFLWGE